MAGPFGPFESTFERLGDTLINKVADEVFGNSGAARQTIVVVYNHGNQDLLYLSNSFESGGFTAGAQPSQITAGTIGGYKVESCGIATGVTGAEFASVSVLSTGHHERNSKCAITDFSRSRLLRH